MITKKFAARLLDELRAARGHATMERASFHNCCHLPSAPAEFEDGRRVIERNVTDFIRERTHIYRASWIIGPLDEAIAMVTKELDGSK